MRAPKSPFRIVHANSNPTVGPLDQSSVGTIIDRPSSAVIAKRVQVFQRSQEFQTKVGEAFSGRYPEKTPSEFVEERIYDAFPSTADMRLAAKFHEVPWEARRSILDEMRDERLRHLGLRLIGTEAINQLSHDERSRFSSWHLSRRSGTAPKGTFRTIEQARSECTADLEGASPEEKIRPQEILSWLEIEATKVQHA